MIYRVGLLMQSKIKRKNIRSTHLMFANVLHKTSKGMRDMNYQDTQQFARATMPKLPIQPLLVLCGVIGCLLSIELLTI